MRENTDQKKLRIWTSFTQCMSYAQFIKMYYVNQRLKNSYLIDILFKNANTDSHFRPFLLLMQQSLPQMDDRKSVDFVDKNKEFKKIRVSVEREVNILVSKKLLAKN